jgi:replication factor C small subunit
MWIETYRPQCLDDIVGQSHITDRLKYMVADLHSGGDANDIPHMMFAGPAGTGKTSTAIAFMKSSFGESWSSNWLELNASDERSIAVIRTKVKDFASRGVIGTYTVNGESKPMPFNVVFLDECDNLTPEAQAALRRTMERYKHTRFILSANYPQKLIDPLKDRCAFSDTRFRPVDSEHMKQALVKLSDALTDDAMDLLIDTSRGSMRKAINLLWTLTRVDGEVIIDDVEEFVVTLQPSKVKALLFKIAKAATKSAPDKNRLFREVDKEVESLAGRGMSGVEILDAIYDLVVSDDDMPLPMQQSILAGLGEALSWASVAQNDILAVKAFLRNVKV